MFLPVRGWSLAGGASFMSRLEIWLGAFKAVSSSKLCKMMCYSRCEE